MPMTHAIAAAACIALLAACSPEGGADRQTGAASNAVTGGSFSGDTAPGVADSAGPATAGTGTTGAQAGGSGPPAAGEPAPVQNRPAGE
jgi:hypothetical protein